MDDTTLALAKKILEDEARTGTEIAECVTLAKALIEVWGALGKIGERKDALRVENKELRERLSAENLEVANCAINIVELTTQRRGLEIELSDVRADLAQAQAERDAIGNAFDKWCWEVVTATEAATHTQPLAYFDICQKILELGHERDAATRRADRAEMVAGEIEARLRNALLEARAAALAGQEGGPR